MCSVYSIGIQLRFWYNSTIFKSRDKKPGGQIKHFIPLTERKHPQGVVALKFGIYKSLQPTVILFQKIKRCSALFNSPPILNYPELVSSFHNNKTNYHKNCIQTLVITIVNSHLILGLKYMHLWIRQRISGKPKNNCQSENISCPGPLLGK